MTDAIDNGVPPFTMKELLDRIDAGWAEVGRAIDGLDEEQLAVAPAGGWAITDHLAHLTTWVRSVIGLLRKGSRAEAMGVSADVWARGSEDEINAEIAAAWATRTADEILIAFRAAQHELRTTLAGMSRDDLLRPYADYQPDDPEPSTDPVINWVVGNTFGHVEMHLPLIQALREAAERSRHDPAAGRARKA